MKPGRNDACPCGSGKKYKTCCALQSGSVSSATHRSPNQVDAAPLLQLFQSGEYRALENRLRPLLRRHADSAFLWGLLGATLQSLGENGLVALERATALSPGNADLLGNLATALHVAGRLNEAEAAFRKAVGLSPGNARVQLNFANLLVARERLDEARTCIAQVLTVQPRLAEAHLALGNVLSRTGPAEAAEHSFQEALALAPGAAEVLFCLGNLYRDCGRFDDARSSYLAAIKSAPDFPAAHNNLGSIALELGHVDDAVACFRQALAGNSNYSEALANLGLALSTSGRLAEAEAAYRRALALSHGQAGWHGKLAHVLQEMGDLAGARDAYLRQLAIDPDAASAKLALTMLTLPLAPATVAESECAARNFSAALDELSTWLAASDARLARVSHSVEMQQPFYLAYRDGNHVELLSRYGDLVSRHDKAKAMPTPTGARIKLVVVSQHIRRHSVWDVVLRGLLCGIDRRRFEVIVYHTGLDEDDETAFAKSIVDRWRDRRQFPHHEQLVAAISGDAPDVILYPEIGMSPFALKLAARRLAPLQLASWGHPITTGLPTIDAYLSGELLESSVAQAHYRERLVRLPGTGCCTTALEIAAEPIDDIETSLATRTGARFLLAQRSFKFDPQFDHVYAKIASQVGECSFLLMQDPVYPWAGSQVRARLARCFEARHLDPERYLVDLPWLSAGKFVSLLDAADVFLDCPAFSGYTTAWQALHRGLPVVTLEGAFLRQRLAAGLLRKIDMPETIAGSVEQYIRLAADAACESANPGKAARRAAIKAGAGKADGDTRVVRAFEDYVVRQLTR